MKLRETGEAWVALLILGSGCALALWPATASHPARYLLAAYATNIGQRTPAQRRNAKMAAFALNGKVIPPHGIFSFNKSVGSWSADRGYVPAPVSYDGELVMAPGGGVCQTSSTLYNAALLAGLKIVERHHHDYVAHYVPPGRDAAVAQYNIDLQVQNPYSWPVEIVSRVAENRLVEMIYGAHKPSLKATVVSVLMTKTMPRSLMRVVYSRSAMGEHSYVRNPGMTGYRVRTYRIFYKNGKIVQRQLLGDDTYAAMNRLVQIVDPLESSRAAATR